MKKTRINWHEVFAPGLDPRQWIVGYGLDLANTDGLNQQLNLDFGNGVTELQIAEIKKILFINQGWRLTRAGLSIFTKLYTSYENKHADNKILTGRVLLGMDTAVAGPWGYQNETITVFDPTVHFELTMLEGSARQFVEFKNIA
jgi:hypothetical protein